jgi:cysteinyl-tRNA synthetase
MKYLGEQFDIHAGGIDHIPVHHTNEIAQSEAATGKKPSVNYWLHNEFLVMDKGKMSKSKGGFLTLGKLESEGFDPLDYRYFLLSGHYRSQMKFSFESLEGAKNARKSLNDKVLALHKASINLSEDTSVTAAKKPDSDALLGAYKAAFDRALWEDLNTPRALAELYKLLSDKGVYPKDALSLVFDMDSVFGLSLSQEMQKEHAKGDSASDRKNGTYPFGFSQEEVKEIEDILRERALAKKAKDFAKADSLRDGLRSRGIVIEDSAAGSSWHPG